MNDFESKVLDTIKNMDAEYGRGSGKSHKWACQHLSLSTGTLQKSNSMVIKLCYHPRKIECNLHAPT